MWGIFKGGIGLGILCTYRVGEITIQTINYNYLQFLNYNHNYNYSTEVQLQLQ